MALPLMAPVEYLVPIGNVATSAYLLYLKRRNSPALMDEGQRRSLRSVKIRKDPSFHYDEEYIKLLEESVSRGRSGNTA